MKNKHEQAEVILAKIHSLLHTAEIQKGDITYLDITRICDYLKTTYFPDGLPTGLKNAFEAAIDICRPATIEKVNTRNKALGAICLIPGGICLLCGLGNFTANKGVLINHPPVDTRWIGHVWWDSFIGNPPPAAPPPEVNGSGIALTVLGIFLLGLGIYFVRLRANTKYQASEAETILRNAIQQWANEPDETSSATSALPA